MRAATSQQTFAPYPLALIALSFIIGILLAYLFAPLLSLCLGMGMACSLLIVVHTVRRREKLATGLILFAFVCAGATLMRVEESSVREGRVQRLYEEGLIKASAPVEVTGVLESAPEFAPESFYLRLRVESLRIGDVEREASGVVWLVAQLHDRATTVEYEQLELRYGARVRVMTTLERADNFRNPGVSTMTEYLERRGYDATGTIKSPLLVERLDDERVFVPLAWLYEWRGRLLAAINEKFSAETAGVLDAALLGNRNYLSHATAERFRVGGTFHVLVISGLHISFIGGLIWLIVSRVTKRRAVQFAVSVLCLWAYALAVGAGSSVVRAALMFTFVALAPVLHRHATPLNSLGGAALVLLTWRPSELFDPSFQLTFLSVLLLVALAWPLIQKMNEVGAWRPTSATPYPPACPLWFRVVSEALFWSEREWRREMARTIFSYQLYKTPLAARLERFHLQRALRFIVCMMIVSASVQAGLLPLLVIYFHRLSFASLILNIVVGSLMALVALTALAALMLAQLSATLAAPLIQIAEGVNWLMVHSVDLFSHLHVAALRLPEYTGWSRSVYALYYAPLIVLMIALARWHPLQLQQVATRDKELKDRRRELKDVARTIAPRCAAVAFVALLFLIVLHPRSATRPDGRLRVDFLDVGQGDAALLTMPDGTTLLIDAGGRPSFHARQKYDEERAEEIEPFERDTRSIGEAVVSEYLWWRGLDHVDYILATHADADHIDGLNDVARNFQVRASIVARTPAFDPEYARFAETARAESVPVYKVGRGDVFRFGAVTAEVLWPLKSDNADAPSANNDSLVLRVSYGQRTFLLTGDIEQEAEAALVSTNDDLGSDVVKVAHHGSKTSSTQAFIQATHPKLAVISVGLTSPFGHPRPEVVERWRATGAEVLTTGKRGTITISTDGHDLQTETFVPK
jgi:competence protein ComEC